MKQKISDTEVEWWSDRVRHYIRKGSIAIYAMERATTDLKWHRIERAIDRAFLGI